MRTYYVHMNITLSAEEEIIRRARTYAQAHNTSLNQLIRDYLQRTVGELSREDAAHEFGLVARTFAGDSGGVAWPGRDVLYEDRVRRTEP